MGKNAFIVWAAVWTAGLLAGSTMSGQAENQQSYETSFATVAKLNGELCGTLDPKLRQVLCPQPQLLSQVDYPYLQPVENQEGTNKLRLLVISSGFVRMLSELCHAQAIESTQRGSLQAYLNSWTASAQSGGKPWSAGPEPQHWGLETMNFQMTQFNQIAGALMAINMAHHYLGHYQKYAGRLTGTTPIASVVTPAEWREAMIQGARNALDCGLGLEGLKSFYDALDKMPSRPAWSYAFLPPRAEFGKTIKDLDQLQDSFFLTKK